MTPTELTHALKTEAEQLGFCLAGACAAVEPPGYGRLIEWLEAGYAGEMRYLENRREAYRHPRHVLDGVCSLLVLATGYRNVDPAEPGRADGKVSRYAWGTDYHDILRARLNALAEFHRHLTPDVAVRGVVDTAPIMEREFAVLAGLGWVGKNTLLLTRHRGSWLFLSVLLTSAVLDYDPPFSQEHCGTCRACIDACPTGALIEPYVLDARRCLSYLTIELRGMPEHDLRRDFDPWVFGCDICQDVCPWNRHTGKGPPELAGHSGFEPLEGMTSLALCELLRLDDDGFRARFRSTPLWRAKRRGLLRNAAMLLGNRRPPEAAAALRHGLRDHEPLVRAASVWALGRLGDGKHSQELRERLCIEQDPIVQDEIRHVLGGAPIS